MSDELSDADPRRLEDGDPTRVGRYHVLRRLGVGGMSIVFDAFDPELDRRVALKLLDPARFDTTGDSRARLIREARAMAQVSHPNVVPVYDVGEHEDAVYIAMELVHGQTLGHWTAETARPWSEVLQMYMQAGRGLAAAHRAGLVHRDFKPENVLVGDDGRARVVDFGLARPASTESMIEDALDGDVLLPGDTATDLTVTGGVDVTRFDDSVTGPEGQVTVTGVICGTPAYMAPEQHLGQPAGPKCDQFSYCVALWEALYLERPFQGKTAFAIADAILEGRLRIPPKKSFVPVWLRNIITRGLATDPRDRHDTMNSMLASVVFTAKIMYG